MSFQENLMDVISILKPCEIKYVNIFIFVGTNTRDFI